MVAGHKKITFLVYERSLFLCSYVFNLEIFLTLFVYINIFTHVINFYLSVWIRERGGDSVYEVNRNQNIEIKIAQRNPHLLHHFQVMFFTCHKLYVIKTMTTNVN